MLLNNAVQIINDARHELADISLRIARNQQQGNNGTETQQKLLEDRLFTWVILKILDPIIKIDDNGQITQILGNYSDEKLNRILLALKRLSGKTRPLLPSILNPQIQQTSGGDIPGQTGPAGANAFLYVGYADDSIGNGYSTSPAGKTFVAFRQSTTIINPVTAATFSGLWRQFVGDQGVAGGNGSDGEDSYTFIAWADADDGSGFTLTFNASKPYIAFLNKNNATPPVQADFAGLWAKYHGDDGNDGNNGNDGADAFVYIAYADADDGTGFTLTFNASKDYIAVLATTSELSPPVQGDFAGLWKNYKGATGAAGANGSNGSNGQSAYLYIAYADDTIGTGFSLTDNTKEYIAILGTATEIPFPVVSDFTGLWRRYRGDGDRYRTNSNTSLTIGTGTKYFTVEAGLAYSTGQRFVIATPNDPSNRMEGTVIFYDQIDGQFQGDVDTVFGSGTFNVWDVNLAAAPGTVAGQNAYYGTIATDQGSGGTPQALTGGADKITQFDTVVAQSPGVTASVASDDITLDSNGAYVVDFNGRLSGPTSVTVTFQIYLNGAPVANMIDVATYGGLTSPELVAIHGVLENVQQGDVIDVRATVSSGTPNLLLENGRLNVYTIGFLQSEQFKDFENTDVDTGTETVDAFPASSGNAVRFDLVAYKGTNFTQRTLLAVWDGTNQPEIDETGPIEIGTIEITFDVDFSGGDIRLRATATSDDWVVRGKRTLIG